MEKKLILRKLENTFRSVVENRNFRLFFFGHGMSRVGLHMQRMAFGWLVYEITGSPLMLGLVAFSREICVAAFAPFAGVAADRWNRKSVLFICQLLFMAQSLIIAGLVWKDAATAVNIIVLSIFHGLISALEIPMRQSFIVDLVKEKKQLGNAIGLSGSVFNAAMLVGPAAGGFIIAAFGIAVCFLVCALTYLGMLAVLFRIKSSQRKCERSKSSVLAELKQGVGYAFDFVPVKYLLLLVGVVGLVALPYIVLMPVVVREIVQGGPAALGILMGSAGFGALTGSVFLASRKTVLGLGRVIAVSTLIVGAGLMFFSLSVSLPLSCAMAYFVGFGALVQRSSANIILQTIADDDKRGRVISFYVVALTSMHAVGDLAAGFAADAFGVVKTLFTAGVICLFCAFLVYRKIPYIRKFVHPVYARLGIMNECGPAPESLG